MSRHLALALLLFGLCSACSTWRVTLSDLTYAADCRSLAVAGEPTYVVPADMLPKSVYGLVPYATIAAFGTESANVLIEKVCARINELGSPDVIAYVIAEPSTQRRFPTDTILAATAFRLAPTRLGIAIDDDGMVTSLDERMRESGILEGDTITSVDGQEVIPGGGWSASPHYAVILRGKPEQRVELGWIRPGTGRMVGQSILLASDRESLRGLPRAPAVKQREPIEDD